MRSQLCESDFDECKMRTHDNCHEGSGNDDLETGNETRMEQRNEGGSENACDEGASDFAEGGKPVESENADGNLSSVHDLIGQFDVQTENETRAKRRKEGGSENAVDEGPEDDELVEAENAYGNLKAWDAVFRESSSSESSVVEMQADRVCHLAVPLNWGVPGSHIGSVNTNNLQGSELGDGSQALEKDNLRSSVADTTWNVNCEVESYVAEGNHSSEEQSLVWPPMLLVCIRGLESKDDALAGVRECILGNGLQADVVKLIEFVCCEGQTFYDLLVLPPIGLSFATAKAVDGIIKRTYTCYFRIFKDLLDIKHSRIPEFSRRFIPNLRYHGMARQAWSDLPVDLLRGDGMCVARGVCRVVEPTECVDGEALGDLLVGVEVLDIFGDSLSLDWKGSVRLWKTTNVLHNGVFLFECLRQHRCSRVAGSYCVDGQDDLDIQQAQGVLNDQLLSSVAPRVSSFEGDKNFDSLPAECSKRCQDALHDIQTGSSQTSPKNDIEERQYGGLSFEEKLLAETEVTQISKLKEFVEDKFEFVSATQMGKKETESIVDWHSQQIARATYKVKHSHMLEKKKWEEQVATPNADLQAAMREAEEKATNIETELEHARLEAEKTAIVFLAGKLEATEQVAKSKSAMQAILGELQEQI